MDGSSCSYHLLTWKKMCSVYAFRCFWCPTPLEFKLIHPYSFLDISNFLGEFCPHSCAEVPSNGLTRSAQLGECNPREESTAAKTCWRNSKHLTGNSHIPSKIGFYMLLFLNCQINRSSRSVNLCEAVPHMMKHPTIKLPLPGLALRQDTEGYLIHGERSGLKV